MDDQQTPGSAFAGPGGDLGASVDTSHAVAMTTVSAAVIGSTADSTPVFGVELAGQHRATGQRNAQLYLMSLDGCAAVVAEITGIAARMGSAWTDALAERVSQLVADGAYGAGSTEG
ncbi:hypothetical protein [Streptacidiphilus cavernicola]|uniref:Uncharacterized protein n=1 Tax=Streptacidiphilus cavernicola TaxID=3342716 RepID=A0ABV6VYH4_9ACTN